MTVAANSLTGVDNIYDLLLRLGVLGLIGFIAWLFFKD